MKKRRIKKSKKSSKIVQGEPRIISTETTNSRNDTKQDHYHNWIELLLAVIPPRRRKPFSAIIILFSLIVVAYPNRNTLNDFFYKWIIFRPYQIEFTKSKVYPQFSLAGDEFLEIFNKPYSQHQIDIVIVNNMTETLVVDSIQVSGIDDEDLNYQSATSAGDHITDIGPRKKESLTIINLDISNKVSVKSALIKGKMQLKLFTNQGRNVYSLPLFDFYNYAGKKILSLRP